MARLTAERDAVVVRLVYDGPPRSGKTTSLGALAASLGRTLVSPEEVEGRTLYFDWLEHVGGRFEGVPIRFQILSVPGQESLAARRRALLAEADAVVFVVNATAGQLPEAAAHLRGLRGILDTQAAPRPGIVVQANQRDLPEALPLAELHEALGLEGLALVESVATESQGVREAFVLSVRLALDRVRELREEGRLAAGPGETDEPEALLAALKALEGESPRHPVRVAVPPGVPPGAPRLPDSDAPIGRVWPPVDGRIVLHAAASARASGTPGAIPRRAADGSWRHRTREWHFHSLPQHEFRGLDEAKLVLLAWAQSHAAGLARLTPRRCIALAPTGWGTWRLWQVVHGVESLRQRLGEGLRAPGGDAADLVGRCVALLLEAREAFGAPPPLPCQLDVIGESRGRPVYCGLLPPPGWEPPPEVLRLDDAELVRREVQPLVEACGLAGDEALSAITAITTST